MPIRIGDVFLLVFLLLVICMFLGNRLRHKENRVAESELSRATRLVERSGSAGSVVTDDVSCSRLMIQETGRKANVAGIWGTFECVEYRFDNLLEVHVHQIDEDGRQLEPSRIHRESFDKVIQTYTAVTSW